MGWDEACLLLALLARVGGGEIAAGVLVAASVVVLLVGLIYALLALRGAFEDPSVPRTLGLVVFSGTRGRVFG